MVSFLKMGQLFKQQHLIQHERTAKHWPSRPTLWASPSAGQPSSHVAIWYWKEKFTVNWRVWIGALPERIVVDETLVKVGGRKSWVFAAIDPATRYVLYLQAFRERGLWQICEFFQELHRLYGRWAAEAIVDGGPWYQGAPGGWGGRSECAWLEGSATTWSASSGS